MGYSASAQTGKISGKVTDKASGETLIGLTVGVDESTKGASTDVEGRYSLTLSPGTYNLSFRYLGYQTKKITGVTVIEGKITSLDIIIAETTSQSLKEVVVTASFKQESVGALYAQQKNSARVSDGISAESIKKSPDKNTGEILKRVSGTTIQDNKFVIIRGLADRYNSASLDNGVLPSTEPNRKAFSFDIVPANMVDNIVINKTATPDIAGDFAGGNVQILTKDIPDKNFVNFGMGCGYNTQTTFKNFQSSKRNTSDYFGFDNGERTLAANFPSTNKIVNNLLSPEQNINALKSLPQDFNVYNSSAPLNQNYQFSIGKVKEYEKTGNKIGAILALTYRNSQNTNLGIDRNYHVYNFKDEQYKFSTNVGGLANLAYNFKKSRITLKNIYNRTFDDQYTYRSGTNVALNGDIKFYAFDLIQKSLFKTALEGEHKIGEQNSKLKWTLGFANVINDQPDQRKVNYIRNDADKINSPNAYYASVTNIGKENTRLSSYLKENIYSAEIGFTKPIKFFKNTATFKTGLASTYRNRDFNVRFLGAQLIPDFDPSVDNLIRIRPIQSIFGLDLINQGKYKLNEINNDGDSYDANSIVNAAYAMLDNKIGKKSKIIYGIRVEQFSLKLNTAKTPNIVEQNFIDILPSVNYVYSVTEKSNIRAAYFRTLARPEFRELAPFAFYDYERASNVQGNPKLQRAIIDNADLRFEFFPSPGQIMSVSAFYKKFKNAIENSLYDANSTPDVSYFNADKATVFGLEFEFRKDLSFLGTNKVLKNTSIYTNLSLIKSKVKNPINSSFIESERPMAGQSPYVINAGVQYTALNNKLNLNLLYNRIGKRIIVAGGQQFESSYEAPRDVLDFQIGLKVLKTKGEFKFNANDILNNYNDVYLNSRTHKRLAQLLTTSDTVGKYETGVNYSLSFNYNF